MNLREELRRLLEGKPSDYESGCVMLEFKPKGWSKLLSKIDNKDLYLGPDEGSTYGKEDNPHVTLLYGLKLSVKNKDVEEVISKFELPEFSLHNPSLFEKDEYDVLKFDVKGKSLHKFNKALRELPYENDYPDYHPHCTIAYLKKNTAQKYLDMFKDEIPECSGGIIVYSHPEDGKKKFDN